MYRESSGKSSGMPGPPFATFATLATRFTTFANTLFKTRPKFSSAHRHSLINRDVLTKPPNTHANPNTAIPSLKYSTWFLRRNPGTQELPTSGNLNRDIRTRINQNIGYQSPSNNVTGFAVCALYRDLETLVVTEPIADEDKVPGIGWQ